MTPPLLPADPVFTELDAAVEQLVIAEKRARDAERKLHRLQRELAGVDEDSPEAKDVQELLDLWWERVKGSHSSVGHKLSSTRAAKVRSTLKRRRQIAKENGLPPEEAMRICRKAIIGITFDDWMMGRIAKSGGKSWNDIADHILNTDDDVEKWAAMFDEWCSQITEQPLEPKVVTAIKTATVKRERTQRENRERWERIEREDPGEAVLSALTRGGWEWRCKPNDGWKAQCPAHQGHDLNLDIDWSADGNALLMICRSRGCERAEIMAALDLPLFTLFRRPLERAA